MEDMITVSNLTYYPIKACRGFDAAQRRVERMGLAGDRRMMVVTPNGKFLTQREHPKLALVTPALEDGFVTLSAPNFNSLRFEIQKSGAPFKVDIWSSKGVHAIDQGGEAANWFSDWLGVKTRLAHVDETVKRKLDPAYAVSEEDHTGFADGYPILIVSEESLADLNARLASPLPMNRFRPNLVVQGCPPFAEDGWKRIRIGGVEMAVVKPCPRCVVTTIDKETLEKNKEPLKTLNAYRKKEGGAMFGMNVIPLGEGEIKTGMRVEVLE
jgi:uncharacterized protein YcbX